jgi:hypothetical protein
MTLRVKKMKRLLSMFLLDGVDFSIKPEDDDDVARGRMDDEMRGLVCGTSMDNAVDIDDTASEEEEEEEEVNTQNTLSTDSPATTSSNTKTVLSTGVSCRVCTTEHPPPVPVCCESCSNVLEPEKLSGERKWICKAPGCQGAELGYVNYEDAGTCGICGSTRQKATNTST